MLAASRETWLCRRMSPRSGEFVSPEKAGRISSPLLADEGLLSQWIIGGQNVRLFPHI
jgi:hypothetical protein